MTTDKKIKYLVVSPCRNESEYMRQTLDTVTQQTVTPDTWVIVNDGSTDSTAEILEEYATKFSWIKIVHRDNRGHRSVGPGVINAFYAGLDTVNKDDFDYLCKLDLDLRLPAEYFAELIRRCEENPRIGTCSGKAYMELDNGEIKSEKIDDEMSVGASKFYRLSCFNEIGGFVREVMWDGIDCHRCRMLGWIAESWDHEKLNFIHLRPMGSSDKGIIKGRIRHGFGQYFMGGDPLYMIAASVYRLAHPPYVIGGAAMMWGYMKSLISRVERYDDPEFRRFLKHYQRNVLFKGKKQVVAELNEKYKSVWLENHG